MKKINFIGLLLLMTGCATSDSIATKTFTLDLEGPTVTSSDTTCDDLEFHTSELLVFKIENPNPFRYRYVIDHKLVDFFQDPEHDPTARIEDIINLNKELLTLDQDTTQQFLESGTYETTAPVASEILFEDGKDGNSTNVKEDEENVKKAFEVLVKNIGLLHVEMLNLEAQLSAQEHINEQTFSERRKDFLKQQLKLLSDLDHLKKEAEKFPNSKDNFKSLTKDFEDIAKLVEKKLDKFYGLQIENFLLPIDVNGKNIDLVEVSVARHLIKSDGTSPQINTYNLWIKGGLKIDMSAGIFLTSLFDQEYETENVLVETDQGEVTRSVIYKKDIGNYNLGFGSTINVTRRFGTSWFNASLSLGALFTSEEKFQLLTGLGIVLGKEKRILLQGGFAMGSVTSISERYQADGITRYDLGSTGTVPTNKKFEFGHFIGITYNLGEVKSQEEE